MVRSIQEIKWMENESRVQPNIGLYDIQKVFTQIIFVDQKQIPNKVHRDLQM